MYNNGWVSISKTNIFNNGHILITWNKNNVIIYFVPQMAEVKICKEDYMQKAIIEVKKNGLRKEKFALKYNVSRSALIRNFSRKETLSKKLALQLDFLEQRGI